MGTFHPGLGRLHGITIVVDTTGPDVYVGRCWEQNEREVRLVSADVYRDGQGGKSKQEWVRHAALVGVWGREKGVTIPMSQVVSIRRLGDVRDT